MKINMGGIKSLWVCGTFLGLFIGSIISCQADFYTAFKLNTGSYSCTEGGSISGTVTRYALSQPGSPGDWNPANATSCSLVISSTGQTYPINSSDVTSGGVYTVNFAANVTTVNFTINFNNNTNLEYDRAGTLSISGGRVDGTQIQSASLSLLDDDSHVAVLFSTTPILEGGVSGANQTTLRFVRDVSVTQARTINYTLSGSATAGTDYTPTIGTVTISQGSTETDLTISANNSAQSTDKTLTVTLASGAYQYWSGYTTDTLTILNDMPKVETYFTNTTVLEGQSTALVVQRTNSYYANSGAHTINYTVGGTAAKPADYSSLGTSATIPAGNYYVLVPTTTTRNNVTNDNKTIVVTLSSSSNYQIASGLGTATATIYDDTPIIGVTPTASTIAQGQTAGFNFYNNNAHVGTPAVTVKYTVSGTASNGVDYLPRLTNTVVIPSGTFNLITNITATFYNFTNAVGTKTVTVTVVTNSYVLDSSSSATIGITPNVSTVNVTAPSPYAIQPGGVGQFTLTRSGGLDRTLAVNYTVSGTATSGVNYTALPASVTFAVNQTTTNLNVTPTSSPALTGAATVVLTLATNSNFFAGANAQAVVTLLPNSAATNSVPSPVGRYWRGSGKDPTYWSIVVPLEGETGTAYDNVGGNAYSLYGIGAWSAATYYHYNATNTLPQTNVANRIAYNNPIVAFGERVGGTPLYINQPYSFGVYAGDPMPIQAPFVITVYNRTNFSVAGFINFNPPNLGNTNSWNSYTSNGDQVISGTNYLADGVTGTTNSFGLSTILSDSPYLNWGTISGTTSTRGAYVLTHTATAQATNYYYVVQAYGWLSSVGAPITQTSGGSYAPSFLYTLEFGQRPNWRSVFLDQPHFDGNPLPPFYAGKTTGEMLTNTPAVTNVVNFTPTAATNLDASPELRRHPVLDSFVASMGNDPIALANYVINSIDLTDPIDYSDNGNIAEQAINPTGVTRGALGTFMEKQGSPIDQCALLVYLLRQAGVPAVYEFPPRGGLKILDARLSRMLKFQVHGGYDEAGNLYTTNTMITVNYPWVAAYIGTNWVHIFPWMKDYQIVEGFNLYDMMPTNYSNAYGWVKDYVYGNTNLLSLAVAGDNTPRVIFPLYLQQTLLQNHPGISVDDIGVKVYNRQHYYARWQDFPTPTWVTNVSTPLESLTSSAITNISPTLTNIFDTVSVEIYSTTDPTKDIKTGDMRLVDLHNREFYIYQTATNGNQVALSLILLPFRTNVASQFSFTNDSSLAARQVQSITLDSYDDQLNVRFKYYRHRALSAAYPIDPNIPFMGLNGIEQAIFERPLRKGDQAAICMSYGRVTRDMLNVHATDIWQMQNSLRLNPSLTNSVSPDVYEGAMMYLAGMSYYEKQGEFDQVNQNLNKVVSLSDFAAGLSIISPARDSSGNLTNNAVYPVLPTVDMFYFNMAFTGNGTTRPDSGQAPQMSQQNYSLLAITDRSAEEHQVINTFYQQTNAVSTVRLLQLAQNSGAGIVALNINNINAQATTTYQGKQLGLWDSGLWSQVIADFSTVPPGYVTAYITPGPMTNSSYKGMAALVLGWGNYQALISPQSLNGAFGQPFQLLSVSSGNTLNFNLNNNDGYSISMNQPANGTTFAPTTSPDYNYQSTYNSILNNLYNLSAYDSQWMGGVNSIYGLPASGTQNQNYAAAFQSSSQSGVVSTRTDDGGSTLWSKIMDPVHSVTGEFYVDETDLQLPGPMPLSLRRNYSSQNLADNQFGPGWKFSIMPYLSVSPGSTNIYAADMDGAVLAYVQTSTNASVWLPTTAANPQLNNNTTAGAGGLVNRLRDRLVQSVNGSTTNYTLYGADGSIRAFQMMTFNNGILNQTRPYLQKWTDNRGNYYAFTFGMDSSQPSFGEVTRIQSSNGNYLGFDYDIYGHVIGAYSGDGRRLIYEYDPYGDLVTVTLPDATTRSYVYQHVSQAVTNGSAYYSTHLLVEEDKPDGRVLQNVYDNQRRVTNQLSTAGVDLKPIRTATFTYANNFNITNSYTNSISGYTLIVDGNNHTNRYDYTNSLITKITDPLNQTIQQIWYADNATAPGYPRSLFQIVDKRGMTNQFQYDGSGNITNTITFGDLTGDGIASQSATNTAVYNTNSLPTKFTDAAGNSTVIVYDPVFSFLPQQSVRYAGATPVGTNFTFYGNATNIVVNGNVTQTNLAFGLPTRQIRAYGSPDAATNDLAYDGHGFITQFTAYTGTGDPNIVNTFFYNERGQMVNQIDALGALAFLDYDALNRPIGQEKFDENGNPLSWNFNYYNDNGELSWTDGPRYNPEDYVFHDYDGAGRASTEIHWRSQAKTDGTGVQAPSGYNLYAQLFSFYDPVGNLTLKVDPRGAMTTNTWDAANQLTQAKHLDTDGLTVLSTEGFGYEPGGQVRYYTNALGGITTTFYTATGKPEFRSNPDGSTNGWRYYLDGRIKREIQSNGAYWQTTYDDANRTTTRIFYSAAGTPLATNSMLVDRRGNVIQKVDAGGNVFATAFDDLDRVKTNAGPAIVTVSSHTSNGMPDGPLVYDTNVLQQVSINFYDVAGRAMTNINALGEKTITKMDALGRPTSTLVYSSSGSLVREKYFTYSADHNSVTTTDGSGASAIVNTVYTDNDGHTVLSVAYPSSGVLEYTWNDFDLSGNLDFTEHDASFSGSVYAFTQTAFTHDGLNRTTAKVDRDNAITTYAFDPLGDVTNRTMPGGLQWLANYNNAGLMLQDWSMGGGSGTRTNVYAYFPSGSPFAGLVQTKTDGRGVACTYSYDDWLRKTNMAYSGSLPEQNLTTTLQYEPRGLVTGITESFTSTNTGPATSVQHAFDPYAQLTTETVNGGLFGYGTSQSWDAAGRRTQLNIGGANYGFGWRADGNLISASDPTGSGSYGFDTSGLLTNRIVGTRVTAILSRDGEGRPGVVTTTVSGATQLTEVLGWYGDSLLGTHTLYRGDFTDSRLYSYATLSRRLTQEQLNLNGSTTWTNNFVYDGGVAAGPGVLTQMGAGAALWNGLVDSLLRVGTETNNVISYAANGHVNGQSTLSAWLDNQPVSVTGSGTNSMQWRAMLELSAGAHQLKIAAAHPSGFYTAWATNTFTNSIAYQTTGDSFDNAGNITLRVWKNANGTTNRTQTLSWDARGRLHGVNERDTNNSGYNWTASYDGLNRRLSTTTTIISNGVAASSSPKNINQYYDPQVEFLELGVAYNNQTVWKLYGPDLNGQYGGLNGTGGFDGFSPYLNLFTPVITDVRGNILGSVTNGVVSWNPTRPTGYGAVPGYRPVALGNGADISLSSAWRGRWVDITGYHQIGLRPYDSVSGRWLTYDSAWNDRDPSYYTFAGGDPINGFDPDGRCAENVAGKVGSGLASFLLSASNEEDAHPLDQQIAANYNANYKYYGNNNLYAFNATFNPAVSTELGAGEAYNGVGLNYYNSGQTLDYNQRVDSAGNAVLGAGQTAAAATLIRGAGQVSVGYLNSAIDEALPSQFNIAGSQNSGGSIYGASSISVTSPNAAMRAAVQGEYINPLTNEKVTTGETLAADHIIPQDSIQNMLGFNFLTPAEASQVLNNPINFQGLPKTFNSSKGALSPGDWTTYKGLPLDPNYIQRNQQLQNALQSALQQQILNIINGKL